MADQSTLGLEKISTQSHIQLLDEHAEFPLIEMRCGDAHCVVSLYGGQVLSYQSSRQNVLWHNRYAEFKQGKAIRSGIPICWPWFGRYTSPPVSQEAERDTTIFRPSHGFARTQFWRIESAHSTASLTKLTLGLADNDETRAMWPHRFQLRLVIQLDEVALKLMLHVENSGTSDFYMSGALHSYFAVSSIDGIDISGLENQPYVDQLMSAEQTQHDVIRFTEEVDRVYQTATPRLCLNDKAQNKRVSVNSFGHKHWVIWNPWHSKASSMSDIATDHWRQFVCMETAIANSEPVCVPANKSYAFGLEIHDASV